MAGEEEEGYQLPPDFQVEVEDLFSAVQGPVKTPLRKEAGKSRTGASPVAAPDGSEAPPKAGDRKRKAAAR